MTSNPKDAEIATMNHPQVGQIWIEVDPRFSRFVRVEGVSTGRCGISIRTVVERDGIWCDAPRSRLSYADPERFNGKRGNYALHCAALESKS